MRKIDFLDRYLIDDEYKITISGNMIHIINYESIDDFSSTQVVVRYSGGVTTIVGNNLIISKMLDDEIVILGDFETIHV